MARSADLQLGKSHQHFAQTHLTIKYLASGHNGETSLAIEHEDITDCFNAYKTHRSREKLIEGLRLALVVVKFAKNVLPTSMDDGLRKEIDFLSWEGLKKTDTGRSMITCLIASHLEGGTHWMTIPYIPGGDLLSLIKHSWKKLSIGLQWHIALNITQLLLYIHWGITDIDTMQRPKWWPLQAYCDLHSANILVHIPPTATYYPALVLADYGNAGRFGSKHYEIATEKNFRRERLLDYRRMGLTIEGTLIASKIGKACRSCKHCNCPLLNECPHPECSECIRIARTYSLLPKLTPSETLLMEWARSIHSMGKMTDDELLAFLTQWVSVAKKERELHYQPMDREILATLQSKEVGDEELLEATGLLHLLE